MTLEKRTRPGRITITETGIVEEQTVVEIVDTETGAIEATSMHRTTFDMDAVPDTAPDRVKRLAAAAIADADDAAEMRSRRPPDRGRER